MSHVSYKWVMSRINESRHSVTARDFVMHTQMSHVSYETWLLRIGHDLFTWDVISSYKPWASHVTHLTARDFFFVCDHNNESRMNESRKRERKREREHEKRERERHTAFSFAEYSLFDKALLHKRLIVLHTHTQLHGSRRCAVYMKDSCQVHKELVTHVWICIQREKERKRETRERERENARARVTRTRTHT